MSSIDVMDEILEDADVFGDDSGMLLFSLVPLLYRSSFPDTDHTITLTCVSCAKQSYTTRTCFEFMQKEIGTCSHI